MKNNKINPRGILKRLDEIEESVNLGTLDTTILGLMIFVFATVLSLVSIGFPKFLINNPYIFTGIFLFIIFVIPLVQYIIIYTKTIFFKEGRFTTKKSIITLLSGEIILIIFLWAFLGFAYIYEKVLKFPELSKEIVIVIVLILLIIAGLITWFKIKPRVNKYFEENFKALLERRNKEIKNK